jgi:hypothetical protein
MSNSAKQREFFDKAIKVVENLGCTVTVERNKHFKAKISNKDQIGTWGVSTTPSNRFSAQRAAISDLKKVLRGIGIDLESKNFGAGLLHMQIAATLSSAKHLDSLIEREEFMSPRLFDDLLKHSYPNLTADNLVAISSIVEIIQKIPSCGSEGGSHSMPDWIILNPHGLPNDACIKNVMVLASDRSNRFPLRWEDAYTLHDALENLFNYYTKCQIITKFGVLVTNVWSPSKLFSFASQVEHFEAKGIQTVVILVSGNSALPVSWPWR